MLVAVTAIPHVRSTGKALALMSEVLSAPVKPLVLLPEPDVEEIELPSGTADLYTGSNDRAPGVLLVHGVAPGGPRDPRMQQIATALGKMGRTVLAPSLAIGDQRLDLADLQRIRDGIEHLAERTGRDISIVSFSFGAAFTLVALQEQPGIQARVSQLTTVGVYMELVHLLQGVTTGRVVSPAGELQEWSPDPEAGKIVTEYLADHVPGTGAAELVEAYEERDPDGLDPQALAIYELMTNTDPRRTAELVGALPPPLPQAVERLSPLSGMDSITVPVNAMHSRQDPASPPSESELMIQLLEPPAAGSLTLVGSFGHVTPGTGAALLQDALPLLGFARSVLQVQEGWGYHF